MTTLLQFLRLGLRVAPPLLWWALGGLAFSAVNAVFCQELWPSTPAAMNFFGLTATLCALSLPWTVAYMSWRLADEVANFFWKAAWRFIAVAGFTGAVISSLVGTFVLLFVLN
jgi:hypothetical protein